MLKVYVINVSYECVGGCKLHRALSLTRTCKHCGNDINSSTPCRKCDDGVHSPKAEVVKYSDRTVAGVWGAIKVPHVIRVFEHIPLYSRRLKYSNRMVWERDDYTCKYCGMRISSKAQLTTDHIWPRSKGGKTCFENMVTACARCNKRKANRTVAESGMRLIGPNPPQAPRLSGHMKRINEEVQALLRADCRIE
jgi:5-methylcytosine-specific restriction endonuclease McrA